MNIENFEITVGINPQQKASFEKNNKTLDYTSSDKLSYLDILSISKGLDIVSDFYDVNAVVMTFGTIVCSVTLGKTLEDALSNSIETNPIEFLTSNIIVSQEVTSDFVKMLKCSGIIVAPKFTKNAIEYLETHEIRYVTISTPLKEYKQYLSNEIIETPLGTLTQTPNLSELNKDSFKVVSTLKPTVEQIEDAVFAWKISKYVRTQAVVIAKDFKTTAIAQGRGLGAIEYALDTSCELAKDAILASDIELSISDLNAIIQCRVAVLIVPSASKEIIDYANKYNLIILTTGISNILF